MSRFLSQTLCCPRLLTASPSPSPSTTQAEAKTETREKRSRQFNLSRASERAGRCASGRIMSALVTTTMAATTFAGRAAASSPITSLCALAVCLLGGFRLWQTRSPSSACTIVHSSAPYLHLKFARLDKTLECREKKFHNLCGWKIVFSAHETRPTSEARWGWMS